MGLNGIGGSPLERFQQARDLAKKKIDGEESRNRLSELLQRKQAEIGGLGAKAPVARAQAKARIEAPAAEGRDAAAAFKGPAAASEARAYGRAGAAPKADPAPRLGRYVDFMA